MKATGREVIDVLEKFGELEWFRYSRFEPDSAEMRVPIVSWRFNRDGTSSDYAKHIVTVFRSVLANFTGNVAWCLRNTGRNWVLMPTQVQELEDSGQFRTDGEMYDYLSLEYPSLAVKAHGDLVSIASILADSLANL